MGQLNVYSLLIGSVRKLFNSSTNGIMGFAGFPEYRKDEDKNRPTWVAYLIFSLLVLVLIVVLRVAIKHG